MYQNTRRHVPEDSSCHNHWREYLKSHIAIFFGEAYVRSIGRFESVRLKMPSYRCFWFYCLPWAGMSPIEKHWCQWVLHTKLWEIPSCESGPASESELLTSTRWPWVRSMVRAWSVGRVSGSLKRDYSAKGVNPDRKSVVPQQVGGLGLRLTSSSFKIYQSRI
jgi:hypothetical protein